LRGAYSWTQVANIKRDPFETSIGDQQKTLFGCAGELKAREKSVRLNPWCCLVKTMSLLDIRRVMSAIITLLPGLMIGRATAAPEE
jgi:hypothetical protein